jgi:hypothetical protein
VSSCQAGLWPTLIYSLRGPLGFPRISLKSTVTRGDALKALCVSTTFAEVLRTSCGLSAGVSQPLAVRPESQAP